VDIYFINVSMWINPAKLVPTVKKFDEIKFT